MSNDNSAPQPTSDRGGGLKFDGGKPRVGLLTFGCPDAVLGVAEVLTFGAKKYKEHSWKYVDNAYERYWDAMERHQLAIGKGETHDPESGLPHIYHIACNAMFLAQMTAERIKDEAKDSTTAHKRWLEHNKQAGR